MHSRFLWHRPDRDSAYRGAFLLARIFREPWHVYATFQGWTLDRFPPATGPYATILPTAPKGGSGPNVPVATFGAKDSACQRRQPI